MLLYTALGSGTLNSLNPKAGVGHREAEFKAAFWQWNTWLFWVKIISLTAGVQPQQDPGQPSGWMASARERQTKLGGWVWSLFLHSPFIPLTTSFFWEVHIAYTQVISKHYSNLTFNRNRMSPTYFSFTRVFLIIWPSGLLTFYGLHLVWCKQLQ